MKKTLSLEGKRILVTGSPGFIGANLVIRLLSEMKSGIIVSLDDMNDYYDINLKKWRLNQICAASEKSEVKHIFVKGSIANENLINLLFDWFSFDIVVNLAGQAGVRYSIDNPRSYINSNIIGFFNILEACRNHPVQHLVYASSSSVYGKNSKIPFSVDDKTDSPVSLYAATKKSDELMAHAYSNLFKIPSTGLRFFTVYGPAGRPDMFYYSTAEKFCRGEKIRIFNYGNMKRDFTYVDDIVEGITKVMQKAPDDEDVPFAVYNIGGGTPENLMDFIETLTEELIRAEVLPADFDLAEHIEFVGMQPGDVTTTFADSTALEKDFGFTPKIGIKEGLRKFAEWYKSY